MNRSFFYVFLVVFSTPVFCEFTQEHRLLIEKKIMVVCDTLYCKANDLIDLASSGDAKATEEITLLLEEKKYYREAFVLRKEAIKIDNGSLNSPKVAKYLVSGSGGIMDVEKGVQLFQNLIAQRNVHAGSIYMLALSDLNANNFQTSKVKLYWYEYFAEKNLNIDRRSKRNDTTALSLYNRVARKYEDMLPLLKEFRDSSDNRKHKYLEVAKKYYLLAGNKEKTRELKGYENISLAPTLPVNPKASNFCQSVTDNRFDEYELHKKVQMKIFENKFDATKLENDFIKSLNKKYSKQYNEKLGIHASNISVKSALEILSYFVDYPMFVIDDSLDDLKLSIWSDSISFHRTINHLLVEYDIQVSCNNNRVTFSLPASKEQYHKRKFITPHLIKDWSGNISFNEHGLFGTGAFYYSDNAFVKGQIADSRLNGRGYYNIDSNDGLDRSLLSGNDFKNGLLVGNGIETYRSIKSPKAFSAYKGKYKKNLHHGQGTLSTDEYIYEGVFKKHKKHGQGKVTYMDNGYDGLFYFFFNNHNHPLLSDYRGGFVDDQKHGGGTCRIYDKVKVLQEFSCVFYKDELIKVGETSLLPPGADLSKHLDLL